MANSDDLSPMDQLRQQAEHAKAQAQEKSQVHSQEIPQTSINDTVKSQAAEIGQQLHAQGVEQKPMTKANEMGIYAVPETPGVAEKSLVHDYYNDPAKNKSLQDKIQQETPEPQTEQPEATKEAER